MTRPQIEVIKLGGSVLGDTNDFSQVVVEAKRAHRAGRRPLLVLSARAGTTDRLLNEAHAHSAQPSEALLACLLATGETAAVALAGIVLAEAGIEARILDAADLGLRVVGRRLSAQPLEVDTGVIEGAFDDAEAVIVPGFVGRDATGRIALLGRGGSDLTALFLAHQLGASCRLVKDTGALFTADPKTTPNARQYDAARWRTALAKGGCLIQPETLRFASTRRITFAVAGTDGSIGTWIGPGPDQLADGRAAAVPKAEATRPVPTGAVS